MKKNIIDRAIEYVAPVYASRRYQAREKIDAVQRGYNGASFMRTALMNFMPAATDANSEVDGQLPALRTRSRDLIRNNPLAGGAVSTVVNHVIGTGLSLMPSIDAQFLKLSEESAEKWQEDVTRRFNAWAESTDCDVMRGQNFYQLQALAFNSMLASGDVFALLPVLPRGNTDQLAIQLIEADRITNPDEQSNTSKMIDGVELDSYGAPIAYYICNQHPATWHSDTIKQWEKRYAYNNDGMRVVLQIMERKRPGQVRGIPYLAGVIEPLKQLGRYTDAELQAAVISGAFALFVKMDPNAFAELFDENDRVTYLQQSVNWNGNYPKSNMDGPGSVVNLLPGESIEESNPGRPNANFDQFFLAITRQIGVELQLPHEILIKHFTSSYSAARAALLDAWRVFRVRREFIASSFCDPIYQLWLAREVAAGRVQAKGFFADPEMRAAWCNAQWIGDAPGNIDESKAATAARDRLIMGITTLDQESIAYDGIPYAMKHARIVKERRMREELDDEMEIDEEMENNQPQG